MNSNLKPFDPAAAMAGAKVVTRDGRLVRILCIDAHGEYPVIVLIDDRPYTFSISGNYHATGIANLDLFMAPVTVAKWVNIYHDPTHGYLYDSKEEADRRMCANRIACVKVEYEV